jgi:NAD(P)-dependent dehydrogenase (short-subunit alcohol dehydrogenase family)
MGGGLLSGSNAFVLGAVDAVGRIVAVALAEAGANVSVTTATLAESEQFFVNSVLNEAWSMGRAGAAFTTDGVELEEIRSAVEVASGPSFVAMPAVSDLAWPSQLASETQSVLIGVRQSDVGFSVKSSKTEGELEVALEDLGSTVVDLLTRAKG